MFVPNRSQLKRRSCCNLLAPSCVKMDIMIDEHFKYVNDAVLIILMFTQVKMSSSVLLTTLFLLPFTMGKFRCTFFHYKNV